MLSVERQISNQKKHLRASWCKTAFLIAALLGPPALASETMLEGEGTVNPGRRDITPREPIAQKSPSQAPSDEQAEPPGSESGSAQPEADESAPAWPGPVLAPAETVQPGEDEPIAESGHAPAGKQAIPVTTSTPVPPAPRRAIRLLGKSVNPGQHRRLNWTPSGYAGLAMQTPVQVVHGSEAGPVLCLTAAVHGDELNGVEIVRRVVHTLDPLKLRGTVIAIPIVNLQGFLRNSRYLPDRRDLNRHFPGSPSGSSARRIAHSLFKGIIQYCDALIDLHTASFHRNNLPLLRADLNDPQVVELTRGFGSMVVLHVPAARGTLRRAAMNEGIPAVTLEAGAPLHLEENAVAAGVEALHELLNYMEMVSRFRLWRDPQPLYYRSVWVRPGQGGILFSNVELGDKVSSGDVLGTVTDPVRNERQTIRAPLDGRILGMALNQMVMPGFAAFHLGVSEGSQLRPVSVPDDDEEVIELDLEDVEPEESEEGGDDPSE